MENKVTFKLMSKCGWMDEPELSATGHIEPSGKVFIKFPEDESKYFEHISYEDLLDSIPDECYVIFD
jgi:hypothetical protein